MMLLGYDSKRALIVDILMAMLCFFVFIVYVSSASVAEVDVVTETSTDLVMWTPAATNTFLLSTEETVYYRPQAATRIFDPQYEAVSGVDGFIADPRPQPSFISTWNSRGDPSLDAEYPGKYRNVILIEPGLVVMCNHYKLLVGDAVEFENGYGDIFRRTIVKMTTLGGTVFDDLAIGWLDNPVPVEPCRIFERYLIEDVMGYNGYISALYPLICFDVDRQWCVHEILWYNTTTQLNYPNKVYTEQGDTHFAGESGRPCMAVIKGRYYLVGLFVSANKTLSAVTHERIDYLKGL